MKSNFFNISLGNIFAAQSSNSEVLSQILYGEEFRILTKTKNWVKIKTKYDNYVGFIKKNKFYRKFKPERKIYKLKTKIFKKKNGKFFSLNKYLYFGSGISIINKDKNFIEFDNNRWVKKNDTKDISHKERNFEKIVRLFLNCKYLWGGKTSDGIDCSALIQIYFYYNRIFFPRDSKDQIKFCKKKNVKKKVKGDIIFWKGHVGVCLDSSKFIHAYGPRKKVIIMPTKFTIDLIYKTTNLVVKKISNIKNY